MKLRYTNIHVLLFIVLSFVKQEDCASLSQMPKIRFSFLTSETWCISYS